ncbi:MAG: GNAT family N-acetyltransferase [Eubacteriales bacterium]|nr:GNAT family N-acetyltransferase [Eubacteriales bacterium]
MKRYRIIDQKQIKTKQLLLTPLNADELAQEEARESDELLRGGIVEMRRNVLEHPEDALWYTGWRISLKKDGTNVGLLGFHGLPTNKTVELGLNIYPDSRGYGYGQEAIEALCNWAFGSTEGYFISVLADEKNEALNCVLKKLKFYRVESPVEGAFAWELERPASAWISFYLCIGLCLGLALGSSFFGSQLTGLTIGLAAGLALGATMDAQDRAARKRENPPVRIDPKVEETKE